MRAEAAGRGGFRPRFFLEQPRVGGERLCPDSVVTLSEVDSRHARSVLRLSVGSACEVVAEDQGRVFVARVEAVSDRVAVRLDEELGRERALYEVLLAQSAPSPPKLDLVVKKGTEVGVDGFVFFPGDASTHVTFEKLNARLPRWERIAREAAKQSRRPRIPPVTVVAGVHEALSSLAGLRPASVGGAGVRESGRHIVLDPGAVTSLREALLAPDGRAGGEGTAPSQCSHGADAVSKRIVLWVGPESGWSESEVLDFLDLGFPVVRLGRGVLRSETAGPVAAAVVRFALGDW